MSKTPIYRIAYVRLSPQGKSYAMRCDRKDLGPGDNVEVEMYAGTNKAYFDDGIITSISHQRWDCSCHVINHIDEVTYSIDTVDGFTLNRVVDLTRNTNKSVDLWKMEKSSYVSSLPESTHSDMRNIYNAIAPEDGEDAYLGDGIWVRVDGSLDDRGR